MRRPRTLSSFTKEQQERAHTLLGTRVAFMMGRKFEEGDWADVYCGAKGIPKTGWSNLRIDVMHEGLGIEHKMLSRPAEVRMRDLCGTRQMHPSATRSIRIPATTDADAAKDDILGQYADLINARCEKVRESTPPGATPEMRTGWLIWQSSLVEFLYFEEEMLAPDPKDYYAQWEDRAARGTRKASRSLWIFERETGAKRYSVTTVAGAKIQPYFDIPPPDDPNVYIFRVQGEELPHSQVRIWVTAATYRELNRTLGSDLSPEALESVIRSVASDPAETEGADHSTGEALPLILTTDGYALLAATFPGFVSDEHLMQLLARRLARSNG